MLPFHMSLNIEQDASYEAPSSDLYHALTAATLRCGEGCGFVEEEEIPMIHRGTRNVIAKSRKYTEWAGKTELIGGWRDGWMSDGHDETTITPVQPRGPKTNGFAILDGLPYSSFPLHC